MRKMSVLHIVEDKPQLVLEEVGEKRGKKNMQITTYIKKKKGEMAYYYK